MNQELIALLSVLPQQVEEDGSVIAYNEFIRITLEKARTFDKTSPTYMECRTTQPRLVYLSSLTEEECLRLQKGSHLSNVCPVRTQEDEHKECLRLENSLKVKKKNKDDTCIQQ